MKCCSGKPSATRNANAMKYVVASIFLAGGAFYLWEWHRAHLFQYWPFAIVLLCPLMHLFHRHGGHAGHDKPATGEATNARC